MHKRPYEVIDYGAFQHSPSALFRDYLSGSPRVEPFYDGARWDREALRTAAQRSLELGRPRDALAAALVRQQHDRDAGDAAERAHRLTDPQAAVVVTGQQAGLFGGPLYVLYKALAAIKVAALLEADRGQPVVPVFWVASDDHDFAEVRSVSALDEAGLIRTLRYSPHVEPVGQPASAIVLDETIGGLVAELGQVLPPGLHRDEVMQAVADSYRPRATLSGAFAQLLSKLLPGLVVLDVADPTLKQLMTPALRREILESSPTSRLAEQVGTKLLEAGYHQQVPVRPGFFNLFVVMEGQRRALGIRDHQVEVRGLGNTLPLDETARLLDEDPGSWSPGVLLRPLAQDLMLPTAAYIGGPSEIAYHAQIGPAYAHFGIPRPALIPRPSLTLVEPSQARGLEKEGLRLEDLQLDPEGLLSRWAREAYPEIEEAFGRTRATLEREMAVLEEALARVEPTLRAAAQRATGRALHPINTLHEKSTRALKKRDQVRAQRLRRTRDGLLPGGAFQERGLGLIGLVARHGRGLIDEIREKMDPWARGHQVLYL